jgi:hypothetical protein
MHNREVWEDSALPVDGPAFSWADIDTIAIHYPGDDDLPDGDPGENADDLPGYIRGVQRHYETHPDRGYSIGYSVAVDWLGGTWELRGDEFRCAANSGWNHRTVAIWVLVDGADACTPEAAAAVRNLVAQCWGHMATAPNPVGHRQIATSGTPCPGTGIWAQLEAGLFVPSPDAPPPPDEEDDMTPQEREKLIDDIATAVWAKPIDTFPGPDPKPQPARFLLQRTYHIVRKHLGAGDGN